MEPLEIARKKIFPQILKPHGFEKKGLWHKKLPNGIILAIASDVLSVKKNDFRYSITCGVYFEGIAEMLYNFPFKLTQVMEHSLIQSQMDNSSEPSRFRFDPDTKVELFLDFVESYLKEKALPFLMKFNEPNDISEFLQARFEKCIKSDSLVILRLACMYAILGFNDKAIGIVERVIAESKNVRYVFAENLLDRLKG